jgi:hypothetical protein
MWTLDVVIEPTNHLQGHGIVTQMMWIKGGCVDLHSNAKNVNRFQVMFVKNTTGRAREGAIRLIRKKKGPSLWLW